MANTPTYGNVNLNNRFINGVNSLQWPINSGGSTLGIYELESFPLIAGPNTFTTDKIPITTNTNWNSSAHYISRQAFHVANLVVPAFSNMDVTFENVHIATRKNTPVANSWAYSFSTLENAYIGMGVFGQNGSGPPMATFDFIAHELGHVYLFPFLNSSSNGAMHEGISDIIGSYIESFILPSGTDWVMGGDDSGLAQLINRNLSQRVCLDDLISAPIHQRGLVIGHWFYAISNGIPGDNIPALGLEHAMDILINSLNGLNNMDATFHEFRQRTINLTLQEFGQCSQEYKAVANAWERVCVSGSILSCPCDSYSSPTLSTNFIASSCGQNEIDLNLLHTGQTPTNTILVWSTDNNPNNGVDPILSGLVNQTGIYYAYYYNENYNCFSLGTQVEVVAACIAGESLTVDNDLTLSNNGNYCIITIKPGATLTLNNVNLNISDKIVVEHGGKIVMDGGLLTNCQNNRSWVGIQAWGNPFSGQIHAVELKNGAVIENAEIGINTSNIVAGGIFGAYFNLSGAKVTTDNATIRNCGIGVNFGPYGYSSSLFSWSDQSYFAYSNFDNCGTGVILQNNLGIQFIGDAFYGMNNTGIELQNSKIDVTGCDFNGSLGILFSATWPSLIGSNITNNNFFSEDGIYMDAQGNASPHQILGNFFASNVGLLGFGQSAFNIQANDFASTIGGVSSWYTGDDYNLITDNGYYGNEFGNSVYGDNNIEYTDNCFEFTGTADIELNAGASISPSQGDELIAAGNCFSFNPILTDPSSVHFDYFVLKNTILQSCKKPGQGNFSEEIADKENPLSCGSGVWSTLPPKYRNCIIPSNLKEKRDMEEALKAEIKRIKNDPNISTNLKKWLIARYERCLKKLQGEIGVQIIKEEQNGKEKAIEYFSSQSLFSHKIMAFAIMMESGELTRAITYLNGLNTENSGQVDFIYANNLYFSFLTNREEFVLSDATKESLRNKALAENELSGYARTIYYILTGEKLRISLHHSDHDAPRILITNMSKDGKISSYPNPVLNNQHIVFISNNNADQKYVIKVRDITGRVVNSVNGYSGENVLNMSNLENGVYIVEVFSKADRLYLTKIVKL